jgi:hypothetical protein
MVNGSSVWPVCDREGHVGASAADLCTVVGSAPHGLASKQARVGWVGLGWVWRWGSGPKAPRY